MDRLGFGPIGCRRPAGSERRSGDWLRRGTSMYQLRASRNVRCAAVQRLVLRHDARMLHGSPDGLRQRMGRILRRTGLLEGPLVPGRFSGSAAADTNPGNPLLPVAICGSDGGSTDGQTTRSRPAGGLSAAGALGDSSPRPRRADSSYAVRSADPVRGAGRSADARAAEGTGRALGAAAFANRRHGGDNLELEPSRTEVTGAAGPSRKNRNRRQNRLQSSGRIDRSTVDRPAGRAGHAVVSRFRIEIMVRRRIGLP